jgi:endoglucanase
MKQEPLSLLRTLTEAHGVTGAEDSVRKIFRENVDGPVITDRLGSIYVGRQGTAPNPVIMLSAHLDEVGFVVQSVTPEGYLKCAPLGGIWAHTVLAQRMRVLTGPDREVLGVVASKPIHFTTDEERTRVVAMEDIHLDVGARSADEATRKFGIRIGQPIVFDVRFTRLGDSGICVAKALDNRAGVGLAIAVADALLQTAHPNTVYCGANAQEEIHGRGAHTAAHMLKPDLGIVLEGVPADDFPGSRKDTPQGALGQGVQVRVMDGSAIMHRKLNELIVSVAEACGIPYQLAVRRRGGTDASIINLNDLGVPVAVLGIPVRYVHTANSLMDLQDYHHGLKLLVETLKRLDAQAYDAIIGG